MALSLTVSGCAQHQPPPPTDPQYEQSATAARLAFDQGLMSQSAFLYERALNRARATDDAAHVGDAAYNLAASLLRTSDQRPEDLARARLLLHESRMATVGAGGDVGGALLLEAKIARRQGDRAAAGALADDVLARSAHDDARRYQARLLKGELAADANDLNAARAELAQADAAARSPSSADQAAHAGLAARLAAASGDPARAATEYDRQAYFLQQSSMYPNMAAALSRAGQSWLVANRPADAADRLFRAARSAVANGHASEVRAWAEMGRAAAEASHDLLMLEQLNTLLRTMGPASQPSGEHPGG